FLLSRRPLQVMPGRAEAARKIVAPWDLGGRGRAGAAQMSMTVKMLLMLTLAQQLEDGRLGAAALAQKVEWINELWYAFDAEDEAVASNAASLCSQLKERLERLPDAVTGSPAGSQLNLLRRSVNQTASLLMRRR
ncbi:unnamed protein product, partial [Prorocentrum cordatum]